MKLFGHLINSYFTPIVYRKHIKCSNLQKLPFKKKKFSLNLIVVTDLRKVGTGVAKGWKSKWCEIETAGETFYNYLG